MLRSESIMILKLERRLLDQGWDEVKP